MRADSKQWRERALASIRSVIEIMESGSPASPQLERHLSHVFTLSRIEFRDGAYEIIKSSALAMSDPVLRIAIPDYYEKDAPLYRNKRNFVPAYQEYIDALVDGGFWD